MNLINGVYFISKYVRPAFHRQSQSGLLTHWSRHEEHCHGKVTLGLHRDTVVHLLVLVHVELLSIIVFDAYIQNVIIFW